MDKLRFDLTVNLGQIITLLGIIFALVVGFTRADEQIRQLDRSDQWQSRMLDQHTETIQQLRVNEARLTETVRVLAELAKER